MRTVEQAKWLFLILLLSAFAGCGEEEELRAERTRLANAEQLSMCGKRSRRTAHECITQWKHLADGDNVKYRGAVL